MTVVINRTSTQATPEPPVSAAAAAREKSGRGGGSLYKPRTPIYPKLAHGRWRTIKWAMLIATLGVYYVVPWLRWARPVGAPQQAVLVDFTGRRFYFFFIQLWPQEVYFITGLLVMAALSLFLVSALFGRLWCGYACPQTVWTDLYITVERLFEGDRNARMKLDAAPLSLDKAWRKGGKHAVWIAIAMATGGAWVFYFHDAPTLWRTFWIGQAPITAYVSVGVLTFTTYALAGTMREQVCTYLCPWPRIQGAMLDEHSLQVTYRRDRGEPRAPHKKNEAWEGRGDCIDCNQCVVVCPMGIDIRDGAQLECINCGLCVDACDEIMVRVARPTALIAYDTDAAVAARVRGQPPVYKFIRSRTIYYAGALAVVSTLMIWGLANRTTVDLEVLRDRNPTFVRLHDGSIRNGYTLKIDNRTFEPRTFQIAMTGLPSATLKTPGAAPTQGSFSVAVGPNQVRAVRLLVTAQPEAARSLPVSFVLTWNTLTEREPSTFLSADATTQ
ncbi:MAG: cytochrome c oxidase accessory protein CcoG [Caulobacterales bacterium]